MSFIAESERISLKLLEENDLELVNKWWNDGRVTAPMGFPNGMGVTVETLHKRFKNQFENNKELLESRMYIIYSKELKEYIGEIQCGEYDIDKKSCRLGIKIGEYLAQGKGYGKEALICFIQYLFNVQKMDLILTDSFPDNLPAYHLYKNLGFEEIEILKDFWTDKANKLHDLIMMELKKENWKYSKADVKYFK